MIEIKNKVEKFLISFTGVLFIVTVVFVMKAKDNNLKEESSEKNTNEELLGEKFVDTKARTEEENEKVPTNTIESLEETEEEALDVITKPASTVPLVEKVIEKTPDKKTKTS